MVFALLIFFLVLIPLFALAGVYAERKIAAFIQDRLGPAEVGPYGLLQTLADVLKLIQKEDIVPEKADKTLFRLAPLIIYTSVISGFAVIPLASGAVASGTETGVFYLMAIVSLDVIGILIAGWASNNKFALYGSLRSVAQMLSYEIPLGLSILCVVIFTGSLDLQEMSIQQGLFGDADAFLFGIPVESLNLKNSGGFFSWNVIRMPLLMPALVIFFISSLAEANRAPFDLPEAESELVAGFQTEYSGMRWAIIMLAEYGMMLLTAFLTVILFLGSWNTPLPNIGSFATADFTSGTPGSISGFLWGSFWLLSKTLVIIFIQIWVRWTFPRLRADKLMEFCWKYLMPAALLLVLLTALWTLFLMR